jgi:hypothetical protein
LQIRCTTQEAGHVAADAHIDDRRRLQPIVREATRDFMQAIEWHVQPLGEALQLLARQPAEAVLNLMQFLDDHVSFLSHR